MNGICWNQIVGAAARRLVAMPGELAGYLALGAMDAMGAQPGQVVGEDIQLGDDGRVVLLRVLPSDADAAEQCMRELLRMLLDVSSSPSTALLRIACPSARSNSSTFAAELQTALIPVNRGAARRALARLHRELLRLPPAAIETPESAPRAVQKISALPTLECNEAEAKATTVVEELERNIPSVARIDELDAVAVDAIVVSPPTPEAKSCLLEIPDLELPMNPGASTGLDISERSAPQNADSPEVRGETLRLASVVGVAPQASCESLDVIDETNGTNADAPLGSAVRETTLVIAPVASRPRLEHTQRLDVEANVAWRGAESVVDAVPAAEPLVQEPTVALPLVTLKRRSPHHDESAQGSRCEAPTVAATEESDACAECPCVDKEEGAECPDHPEDEAHSFELTDMQAEGVSSNWDATSMDTVVEISDDEIVYEQVLEEEIWLDVDCSDNDLFVAVAPRIVMFEQAAAFAGCIAAENAPEVFVAADASSVVTVAELPDCSGDDSAVEVEDADLLVVDDEGGSDSDYCFEASRTSYDNWPSPGVARSEPTTLYRSDDLPSEGPRSTLEGLSGQFGVEPTWTQGELCRSLRFVAGLDLSPSGPPVEPQTPPPSGETVLRECSEQAEPTRRLRRAGSVVAVLLVVGAGAHSVRFESDSVPYSAQLCGPAGTR